MVKTITLARQKDNRLHKTTLREDCSLHIDIIDKLYYRCLNKGIIIDIDNLIDMVSNKQ